MIDMSAISVAEFHMLKRRYGVTTPASFPGCPDCEPSEVRDERPACKQVVYRVLGVRGCQIMPRDKWTLTASTKIEYTRNL